MSSLLASKPPLPGLALHNVSAAILTDGGGGIAEAHSNGSEGLKTSQKETMSDGSILGLNDVYYQNEPDLSYFCASCQRFITLLSFRDHKACHNAMNLLELSHPPTSTRFLLDRRNLLLRKLKEAAAVDGTSLDIKSIQLIDDAYEILKQELEDTFESCRKIEENINFKVDSYDLNCSLDFVSAIGHCSDRNARWKSKMEDCKVYQDYFGNCKDKAFLALYDGYNGRYASAVAANELHYLLLTEMAKFNKKSQCKCTFNMLEENDIARYDLIRPPRIPCGHARQLHKTSANVVQQIIYTCELPEAEDDGNHNLSSHHPINSKPSEDDMKRMTPVTEHKVKDEYCESMKAAFHRAYKLTDRVLAYGGDEKSRVRWSGCSAVTIVLEQIEHADVSSSLLPSSSSEKAGESKDIVAADNLEDAKSVEAPRTVGRLHLANSGNCHAVLVRGNRPYLITKPHTYQNAKERKRIISSGGSFSRSEKEMRVNGVSLTTRGLGNHGDPTMKELISWEPYCATVPIDQYAQLLIVATNGVWQVFSPQEAAELLLQCIHLRRLRRQILPQNRMPTPGYISPSVDMLKHEESIHEPEEADADPAVKRTPLPTVQDDEFAEEVIPLPPEESVAVGRKSSLSVPPATAERRSRGQSASVTFEDNVKEDVVKGAVMERFVQTDNELKIEEEELEEELRDFRSDDSGNEADVDTDWASTAAPDDLALRSALSSHGNAHRQLSKLLSERLVQSALLAGSKDNISAIVLVLPSVKLL